MHRFNDVIEYTLVEGLQCVVIECRDEHHVRASAYATGQLNAGKSWNMDIEETYSWLQRLELFDGLKAVSGLCDYTQFRPVGCYQAMQYFP